MKDSLRNSLGFCGSWFSQRWASIAGAGGSRGFGWAHSQSGNPHSLGRHLLSERIKGGTRRDTCFFFGFKLDRFGCLLRILLVCLLADELACLLAWNAWLVPFSCCVLVVHSVRNFSSCVAFVFVIVSGFVPVCRFGRRYVISCFLCFFVSLVGRLVRYLFVSLFESYITDGSFQNWYIFFRWVLSCSISAFPSRINRNEPISCCLTAGKDICYRSRSCWLKHVKAGLIGLSQRTPSTHSWKTPGIIMAIMGLLQLSFLVRFLSRPALSGPSHLGRLMLSLCGQFDGEGVFSLGDTFHLFFVSQLWCAIVLCGIWANPAVWQIDCAWSTEALSQQAHCWSSCLRLWNCGCFFASCCLRITCEF